MYGPIPQNCKHPQTHDIGGTPYCRACGRKVDPPAPQRPLPYAHLKPHDPLRRLVRMTSMKWWVHRLDDKELQKTCEQALRQGRRVDPKREILAATLTAQQWVLLHTDCNGRPPWRDAKIHVFHTLVCRGCGLKLQWSDDLEKLNPERYEVSL